MRTVGRAAQILVMVVAGAAAGVFAVSDRGLALRNQILGVKSQPDEADAGPDVLPGEPGVMEAARGLFGPGQPSRIIYLNREGATLRGGPDDATLNISSIVSRSGAQQATMPAFRGSHRRWEAIVKCIRSKFARYDVQVVDRRPVGRDYMMAVLGGRVSDLGAVADGDDGHRHSHATGLAPFSGEPIANAVVFIFTRALKESLKASCEVASMEIAHAYGLDHARHCKDVMTYKRPCGTRVFTDRDLPCGEHEDRTCRSGSATQNAHRTLLSTLGPAATPPE